MGKRIVSLALTIMICSINILRCTLPAHASESDNVSENVFIISEATAEGYEASVISQMAGRAGASTPNGAKGIAFEILYKDKNNLNDFLCFFKPSTTIKLSESSTDTTADLIVTDAQNHIALIQCKDGTSPSYIRKILQQVTSGKYDKAKLVGTKECAEIFNKLAEKNGISARMVNSGISTKTTQRIAEKALGGSIETLTKNVARSSITGGAFCGAIAAIDSVLNGESTPYCIANASTETFKGIVSIGAGKVAGELITAGLAYFSAPHAVTVIGGFAAALIAGEAVLAELDKLTTELGIKESIAQWYENSMMGVGSFIVKTEDTIDKTSYDDIVKETEVILDDTGMFWGGVIVKAEDSSLAKGTKAILDDAGMFYGYLIADNFCN